MVAWGWRPQGRLDFCKCWMAFGLPQININMPRAPGELPAGLRWGFSATANCWTQQHVDSALNGGLTVA